MSPTIPSGQRHFAPGVRRAPTSHRSVPLLVLLTAWMVVLFDPQWYFVGHGAPAVINQLPTVLYAILFLMSLTRLPPPTWAPSLLCFILVLVASVWIAPNYLMAKEFVKSPVLFYVLIVATLCIARRIKDMVDLVMLWLLACGWWCLWGSKNGLVGWSPYYANYDSYGPLMVVQFGICYYCGVAATNVRVRQGCYFVAALSIIGLVASLPRGAMISAAMVGMLIWSRSPRKIRSGFFILLMIGLVFLAAKVLLPSGYLESEMTSAFTEGATEGTGGERWELWKAAWKIFLQHPIMGVGANNFGVYAAFHFKAGQVGSRYADDPMLLYGFNLHNIYFQMLSETGLLGTLAFLGAVVQFWICNIRLRSRQFAMIWAAHGDPRFELKPVALALEAAMMAFLLNALYYNQLLNHWFYTLFALNVGLYAAVAAVGRRMPKPQPRRFQ